MRDFAVHTGREELRAFLSENRVEFHSMNVSQFQKWLRIELRRKERDATFQKRCTIRDVRKQHYTDLSVLEGSLKEKEEAFLASPHRQRLEGIEREEHGANRAIEGISQAMESSPEGKQKALLEKRDTFVKRLDDLAKERQLLLEQAPEKGERDKAARDLSEFEDKIGITQLEEELVELNKVLGKRSGKAGVRFEVISTEHCRSVLFPLLLERKDVSDLSELRVLSGITLGAAHTEIDNVIVRYKGSEEPVDVLAVVEAKSNINDIVSGFLMRQQNIGFLCGEESMYDPQSYVTKVYREGRFSVSAVHVEDGEEYLFNQDSFKRFKVSKTYGYFLDRLYFIVRYRKLNGLSSGEYSRIMYRISNDFRFDIEDKEYLRDLHAWVLGFVNELQTRDILKIYQKRKAWGQQCLLLEEIRDS